MFPGQPLAYNLQPCVSSVCALHIETELTYGLKQLFTLMTATEYIYTTYELLALLNADCVFFHAL